MCTTTTVYPGSCQPKATSCVVDTDCPVAWKCIDAPIPNTEPAMGANQSASSDGGAAPRSGGPSNGAATSSPPASAPPVKTCESPYDLGIRNGTTKGDGQSVGTPGTPAASDNGTSGGTMGTTPPATSGSTPGSGSGSTTSPSAGGCSINPGTETSHLGGLALLTLLGLIAVRRLRRI
jgi:MYXO-CTERM domain-containing protein